MPIDLDKLFDLIDENAISQDKVLAGKMWVALAKCSESQLDQVQVAAVNAAYSYWHHQLQDQDRQTYLSYISLKLDRFLGDGQNETVEAYLNRIVFASLLGNEGMSDENLGWFLYFAEEVGIADVDVIEIVCRFIPEAKDAIE